MRRERDLIPFFDVCREQVTGSRLNQLTEDRLLRATGQVMQEGILNHWPCHLNHFVPGRRICVDPSAACASALESRDQPTALKENDENMALK